MRTLETNLEKESSLDKNELLKKRDELASDCGAKASISPRDKFDIGLLSFQGGFNACRDILLPEIERMAKAHIEFGQMMFKDIHDAEDKITQLKDAQAEIKSLNTFNTQFTRADKISWGGLYIQVEQLEQRLAECEDVVKFYGRSHFYQSCSHGQTESIMVEDHGQSARDYLSKWGVK